MREELKKIALELRKWAEKYDKDYITISCMDNRIITFLDRKDKDYNECDLFIESHEERE